MAGVVKPPIIFKKPDTIIEENLGDTTTMPKHFKSFVESIKQATKYPKKSILPDNLSQLTLDKKSFTGALE